MHGYGDLVGSVGFFSSVKNFLYENLEDEDRGFF